MAGELNAIIQRLIERRNKIDATIQILQQELGGGGGTVSSPFVRRRRGRPPKNPAAASTFTPALVPVPANGRRNTIKSLANRRAVSLAQKRRWAAWRRAQKKG